MTGYYLATPVFFTPKSVIKRFKQASMVVLPAYQRVIFSRIYARHLERNTRETFLCLHMSGSVFLVCEAPILPRASPFIGGQVVGARMRCRHVRHGGRFTVQLGPHPGDGPGSGKNIQSASSPALGPDIRINVCTFLEYPLHWSRAGESLRWPLPAVLIFLAEMSTFMM